MYGTHSVDVKVLHPYGEKLFYLKVLLNKLNAHSYFLTLTSHTKRNYGEGVEFNVGKSTVESNPTERGFNSSFPVVGEVTILKSRLSFWVSWSEFMGFSLW